MTDVFRPSSISYLRIPAPDPAGHVIGHFVNSQAPTGDDGIRPYIYVDSVTDTIAEITGHGGTITKDPFPEGNLTVALFQDPAGNTVGIWQQTPR